MARSPEYHSESDMRNDSTSAVIGAYGTEQSPLRMVAVVPEVQSRAAFNTGATVVAARARTRRSASTWSGLR
jgi:hypothetical protein